MEISASNDWAFVGRKCNSSAYPHWRVRRTVTAELAGNEIERISECAGIGPILPSNVVGASVGDRSKHNRGPHRDGGRTKRRSNLDWNVALVVIHSDIEVV